MLRKKEFQLSLLYCPLGFLSEISFIFEFSFSFFLYFFNFKLSNGRGDHWTVPWGVVRRYLFFQGDEEGWKRREVFYSLVWEKSKAKRPGRLSGLWTEDGGSRIENGFLEGFIKEEGVAVIHQEPPSVASSPGVHFSLRLHSPSFHVTSAAPQLILAQFQALGLIPFLPTTNSLLLLPLYYPGTNWNLTQRNPSTRHQDTKHRVLGGWQVLLLYRAPSDTFPTRGTPHIAV